MKKIRYWIFCMVFSLFVSGIVQAEDLIIYPTKGQSHDQMEKDKYECYSWAKQESGFDPMIKPTDATPLPQQQAQQGETLKNAEKTAAAVALGGGVIGAAVRVHRRRKERREQAYEEQQRAEYQVADYENNRNEYNRAYSSCLEGKGYTVTRQQMALPPFQKNE